MALDVEDGTGRSAADSYVSLTDFKAYCDARGYSYSGSADATLEQKLRLAADYMNSRWKFKGIRLLASQSMEFPRSGCYDQSGYEVTGVPLRVKNAACELAFVAISESLFESLDRGGMVTSESVGPISVTYADGAPAGKVFVAAEQMLAPLTKTGNREFMAPRAATAVSDTFASDNPGYFKVGGMDFPGGVSDGEV